MVVCLAPGMLELTAIANAQGFDPLAVQILEMDLRFEDYALACWEGQIPSEDLCRELAQLLGGDVPSAVSSDARVNQLFASLHDGGRRLPAMSSRTRLLMRAHLGTFLRQLRRWERMRELSCCLAQGQFLTQAAHQLI